MARGFPKIRPKDFRSWPKDFRRTSETRTLEIVPQILILRVQSSSKSSKIIFLGFFLFYTKRNNFFIFYLIFTIIIFSFFFSSCNLQLYTLRSTILVISLGTLYIFNNKWSLSSPPPPHPQCSVDFYSSNLATKFQHCFGGQRGSKNWILTSHFKQHCYWIIFFKCPKDFWWEL